MGLQSRSVPGLVRGTTGPAPWTVCRHCQTMDQFHGQAAGPTDGPIWSKGQMIFQG